MVLFKISIPSDSADSFSQNWKHLRLAEALDPDFDLSDPAEIENFDGATLVQWAQQIVPVSIPLIGAALTYIIASRGEFEYEKDGEKIRFKNLKPSTVREILDILDRDVED